MRSKHNSTTAPHPALESTSNVALNSFVQVVQDDTSATVLPNLLVAVQQWLEYGEQ